MVDDATIVPVWSETYRLDVIDNSWRNRNEGGLAYVWRVLGRSVRDRNWFSLLRIIYYRESSVSSLIRRRANRT